MLVVDMLLPPLLWLGGGIEKPPDMVVVGESEELDERCLPIRIFSTVKLEMDLFGGFLEPESDLESSQDEESEMANLLLEPLAPADSSLLDVEPWRKRPAACLPPSSGGGEETSLWGASKDSLTVAAASVAVGDLAQVSSLVAM